MNIFKYLGRSVQPPTRCSGNSRVTQFCLRFTSTHRLSQLEKETCSQVSQVLRLAVRWNKCTEICMIGVLLEASKCLATLKVLSISRVAHLLLGFGWGGHLSPLQLQRVPALFSGPETCRNVWQVCEKCMHICIIFLSKVSSRLKCALATAVWLSFVYVLRPLTACPNQIYLFPRNVFPSFAGAETFC